MGISVFPISLRLLLQLHLTLTWLWSHRLLHKYLLLRGLFLFSSPLSVALSCEWRLFPISALSIYPYLVYLCYYIFVLVFHISYIIPLPRLLYSAWKYFLVISEVVLHFLQISSFTYFTFWLVLFSP